MIPPAQSQSGSPAEQRLRKLFKKLGDQEQKTLLEFAEFLVSRFEPEDAALPEPNYLPRPEDESVIKAVKRLSETYFMLDKDHILHETSALVSQHIMQGRAADEVIDELESVFAGHYEKLKDTRP
jgi:hypothetical protein